MLTFREIGHILHTSNDYNERQAALQAVTSWWVETCLRFGASVRTAHNTAAVIAEGMDKDFRPGKEAN